MPAHFFFFGNDVPSRLSQVKPPDEDSSPFFFRHLELYVWHSMCELLVVQNVHIPFLWNIFDNGFSCETVSAKKQLLRSTKKPKKEIQEKGK